MSQVWHFEYGREGVKVLEALRALFERVSSAISPGDLVVVKVHVGERGNVTYLRPVFAWAVVELVKEAGGRPVVADTTTIYPYQRFRGWELLETAAVNGFTPQAVGAPVMVADGLEGREGRMVILERTVRGCTLREVEVASLIAEAQAMVVLSHVKGHELSGLGGAIKQLGMGCTTKRSKADQHAVNSPVWSPERCDGCGTCQEACVYEAIRLEKGRPVKDEERCMHCSECMFRCPQGAWSWPEGSKERFQIWLAHAARAVMSTFGPGKVAFLNFVQDVTPMCDCAAPAGLPLVADVGVLASLDPVAIDRASLDLIDRAPAMDPGLRGPDRLGRLKGTSSLIQMEVASELGMGQLHYDLLPV